MASSSSTDLEDPTEPGLRPEDRTYWCNCARWCNGIMKSLPKRTYYNHRLESTGSRASSTGQTRNQTQHTWTQMQAPHLSNFPEDGMGIATPQVAGATAGEENPAAGPELTPVPDAGTSSNNGHPTPVPQTPTHNYANAGSSTQPFNIPTSTHPPQTPAYNFFNSAQPGPNAPVHHIAAATNAGVAVQSTNAPVPEMGLGVYQPNTKTRNGRNFYGQHWRSSMPANVRPKPTTSQFNAAWAALNQDQPGIAMQWNVWATQVKASGVRVLVDPLLTSIRNATNIKY